MKLPSLQKKKLLSLVIPVYDEEGSLFKLWEALEKLIAELPCDTEMIMVNDGSKDQSALILAQIAAKHGQVKVINFSKNFGHQAAITAGMAYAKGDAVVILDADLQDPPELIKEMYTKWQEGFEIVSAKRRSRQDGFFKDWSAKLFYKFLNLLLKSKIPENVGDFRLISRNALDVLNSLPEKDRYLRGLSVWIGFQQCYLEYDRAKRYAGSTHYTMRKMFTLALDAIFSFSKLPMRIAFFSFIFFTLITLVIVAYTIYSLAGHAVVPGWASQMLAFTVLGALQMLVLAIISEYVGRIYTQVQNRPIYIVENTINLK